MRSRYKAPHSKNIKNPNTANVTTSLKNKKSRQSYVETNSGGIILASRISLRLI